MYTKEMAARRAKIRRERFGEVGKTYAAVDVEATHRVTLLADWVEIALVAYEMGADGSVKEIGHMTIRRPIRDWGADCKAFWETPPEALAALEKRCAVDGLTVNCTSCAPGLEPKAYTFPGASRREQNMHTGQAIREFLDSHNALLVTDMACFDGTLVHALLDQGYSRSLRYGPKKEWLGSRGLLDTGAMERLLQYRGTTPPGIPEGYANTHDPLDDARAIAAHHGALLKAAGVIDEPLRLGDTSVRLRSLSPRSSGPEMVDAADF